jgi:hypothetical protein
MVRSIRRFSAFLLVLLLLPAVVYAQAAITGVVKDVSGGVLPGVTVEAASPVLIERVRSVVSDATGQYRIVDLRPGTYSVTFSLPGFSTVKREGIELTGTFVATVNGDLKVGALEETITVTGETPIVDVQSAKLQQTVSKEILAAIPTSRSANGIQALIPGMATGNDFGGIQGGGISQGTAGSIHGGKTNDSRSYADGLNTGYAGVNGTGGNQANVSGAQEVVLNMTGGLGEAEAGGVIMNVIPRDGANTFSGTMFVNGSNSSLQGDNYTQALKDQGLKSPSRLMKLFDVNPMGGGRIIRDRLWFYLTYREWGADNTVPGIFVNRNAGDVSKWYPDFDESKPAYDDQRHRNGIGRITWQASPRNKVNLSWSEQYDFFHKKGGGTGTQTIEATGIQLFQPSHIQQATWSSPVTNRILVEAGMSLYQARFAGAAPGPRVDGTHNPALISVQEQSGTIPNLRYRFPSGTNGGFGWDLIGTKQWRASISYVSGAHNMKFGYQGGYDTPENTYTYFGPVFRIRMNNQVINQLTQTVAYPGTLRFGRNLVPVNFYGQDQWTSGKLTLQGGIRWDNVGTSYPDSAIGGPGYQLMPVEVKYPRRTTQHFDYHNVTPRMGVAYDLFGNGKTAVKFNLGKYMTAVSVQHADDMNLTPTVRIATSTTRTWTDSNKDFIPNCDLRNTEKNGECGAMDNKNFGQAVFSRSYDDGFISGWGTRPYNWGLGASIQQELAPRVSLNVGFFRNWWGNDWAVDNRATILSDYTPFSIVAPSDSRLPGGGGYTVGGLYNLVLPRVGAIDELAQHAKNFGELIENWQGADVSVSARLRNGITVQGGTSTGRRLSDACAVKSNLPEYGAGPNGANNSIAGGSLTNPYCRVVEPYQTDIKGLATYTIPRVGLLVSGTWQSVPGNSLAANYTVTSAVANVGPQPLGRNLSSGNVTVNLLTPQTVFADRRNNVDFRISKVVRYGRTRTQVGIDVYNVMNSDVVTTFNQGFVPGGSWLTPTAIVPARYFKISTQVDF